MRSGKSTKSSRDKQAYKAALADLREEYHEELKKNLQTLLSIRDNPQVSANVRVDAIRYSNQMLGLPRTAQEKPPEPPKPRPEEEAPSMLSLRPELLDELDNLTKRRPVS